MKYKELAEVYELLENTSSSLKKTEILANFLKDKDVEILDKLTLLAMGRVFPEWSELEIGIAAQLMIEAISKASGISKKEINDQWREKGDLGLVAEYFMKNRKQRTLISRDLTVENVYNNLAKMATLEGQKSQEKKILYIAELLTSAKPKEARYIVRTILQTLRIGVGEGIVRDAIAQAFNVDKDLVERAHEVTNDFSKVAKTAKEKGNEGLKKLKMELFKPVKVMLAQKVNNVDEGFERVQNKDGFCAVEYKLDGMRCQIHKKGNEVQIFTRRLENVTKQFPDVIKYAKECIKAESCIIDSEVTAYNPKNGTKIPFQRLSKRIKRKYNIDQMVREIPVFINAFDLLFLNNQNIINMKYKDRWNKLNEIVKEKEKELVLVTHKESNSHKEVEEFYKKALEEKNEGIMFKNLEAEYKPGSRVGYMVKLKPIMETLDLVIVSAEWGEGKRSNWLSSFKLACINENEEYVTIGKMATGLTEEQFEEITQRLKKLIVWEKGRDVKLKPEVVVEVAYEEIQKSPTYESGYALRFPRLVKFRDDLGPEEINSLEKIKNLYETQKLHRSKASGKAI